VIGYELLYRSNEGSTSYDGSDPDQASSEMIMMGLDASIKMLAEDRLAFINFTENLILNEAATILPKSNLVVEILESISPNEEVLRSCRKLKRQGYTLSLDDFIYSEESAAFLELADIVKIDFLNRDMKDIERDVEKIARFSHIHLLAEKVETREVFELAKGLNFVYFQGYFFSKPVLISRKKLTPVKANQLQLIHYAMDPLVDYKKLASIIANDAVLSYRILRLVNSAYYGLQYKVKNIRHALAILGIRNIRKYVALLTIDRMNDEKPEELIKISMVRGRVLEALAGLAGMRRSRDELFMLGLFSLIDVLSDSTMDEVLERINLPNRVSQALVTGEGKYADMLNIVMSYERGDWSLAAEIADRYKLSIDELFRIYVPAIEWANEILAS
jgi:EAL and modified HD-GYP domain-containing signal transduction protein